MPTKEQFRKWNKTKYERHKEKIRKKQKEYWDANRDELNRLQREIYYPKRKLRQLKKILQKVKKKNYYQENLAFRRPKVVDNKKDILTMRDSGFTLQQIADRFSCSKERIRQIILGIH